MVYVNGEIVPESQAVISALDRGFRYGDAVYDTERTFGGRVFKLDAHLDRLYRALIYTHIDPGVTLEEMKKITLDVVEANQPLLRKYGDFNVNQIISRGNLSPELRQGSNVAVYCRPLPLKKYAQYFIQGVRAATSSTRRTPPESLSPSFKIANKMNLFVAEFGAKQHDPDMVVLMLDLRGNITEGSSSNFMFVKDGNLKIPNTRNVLQGITMGTIVEYATNLGLGREEGDYTPSEVYTADEAFFCSSTTCLLPVKSLNDRAIGDGEVPGPFSRSLFGSFSDIAGFDVVEQAISFLTPQEKQAFEAVK